MAMSDRVLDSGVALVEIHDWRMISADVLVEEISGLIQDNDAVRTVLIRAHGDIPDALRYLVRILDRHAAVFGKAVDFSPPAA